MEKVVYEPIGVVHSPYNERSQVPRQGYKNGARGEIEIYDKYKEGLSDIEGFSHIVVIFHFHESEKRSLKVVPPWDGNEHGVFSTRSPSRPNSIGITVMKLESVEGCTLKVSGIDMLDGTPVIDIKPYIPDMNPRDGVRTGWLENVKM
jgi:tRNA-Thr(GGU) m(6)t(6)A37 methyltransferase TsaA